MTRKRQTQSMDDGKSRKRILKPVVEKKRRDRINQSLAELRSLLLNSTCDPRLQNPKIEKAEILDLTVEYLQKWTDGRNQSNDSSNSRMKPPLVRLGHSDCSPPPRPPLPPPPPPFFFSMESAGFQQCVAQLSSYMHRIPAAQRAGLIERLRLHSEGWQPKPDFHQKAAEAPDAASVDAICTSDTKEESVRLLFPSHSPFQPHSCSTPAHDYLSPPPSPWFSPSSFPPYAASPPFPSFACHFSFPPSLSPPSSNTSFFSFSPTLPHSGLPGLHVPPNPVHREGLVPNSSLAMWRPWF
ncbi:transcription factor HES-7-like [Stegastes partitus]|uniref:Transcription factor HES-7-like n=1 Tax=Stegastes partitus TaxID=144197 RepID=A0A9Y4K0Q9_9TELE|nr:PREDICTED: transcription factor HES-7-like [Stegastes partitus]